MVRSNLFKGCETWLVRVADNGLFIRISGNTLFALLNAEKKTRPSRIDQDITACALKHLEGARWAGGSNVVSNATG